MATILAIDPGGRQTASLARLARELRGHELMAADSCSSAIAAIRRNAPDIVLIPSSPGPGYEMLMAELRAVPRIKTLSLPSLASVDPAAYAQQILSELMGPRQAFVDQGRAQVIAAANAAVNWIRARRASWGGTAATRPIQPSARVPAPTFLDPLVVHEPVPMTTSVPARAPAPVPRLPSAWPQPPDFEPAKPAGPSAADRLADGAREARDRVMAWVPRVAALAVLIGLAVAGFRYLPGLMSTLSTGTGVFESVPPGSQVFIDGSPAGTAPVTTDLPAGEHTVEFRNGKLSRTSKVVIVARSRILQQVDWTAKPTGGLQVSSQPTGARVLVDGVARGNTPVTLSGLSAGSHTVTIESSEGSIRRSVSIAAGQTAQLNESILSGSLAVFSPFEIEISEGNRRVIVDERGRALLPSGPHKLRFRNVALGYDEVQSVDIRPAQTTTLNLQPRSTLAVTANEPAEVSVDGAPVGSTPLARAAINIGTRTIVVKNGAGDERRFTMTVTTKPVQIDVDFTKP